MDAEGIGQNFYLFAAHRLYLMVLYHQDNVVKNCFGGRDQCLRMASGNQTEISIIIAVGKGFIGNRKSCSTAFLLLQRHREHK